MNGYPVACDIKALQQMERLYLKQLRENPHDLEIRLGLAWCLFMQAIHQSGRESISEAILAEGRLADHQALYQEMGVFDQQAYRLLKDSLHQTFTIMQLSAQTPQDVEKLHELIRLSGADQAVSEAESEALNILAKLAEDIFARTDGDDPMASNV